MKHKVFRALCALLLVCVLLVSWSPIRARAMMPVVGWDSFAWNLADIIASGAIGIGTSPGSVPDDWNNMIEDAKQACQDFFGFVGDTMKIYRFFDGSSYKLYAKADFVEWLRDWTFDSGYLEAEPPGLGPMTDGQYKYFITASSHPYAICWYSAETSYWNFIVSRNPFDVVWTDKYGGLYMMGVSEGTARYFYVTPEGNQSVSQTITNYNIYTAWSWCGTAGGPGGVDGVVVTPYDLSLSGIASPQKMLADGYPEWVQNSVYIPAEVAGTEEEVLALPLGLGQTLDETQGLNQEQIWAGESTLEVEIEEVFEGTVSGTTWADFTMWFGQKLEWIPKYILEGITAIFVPSADFLQPKIEEIKLRFPFIDGVIDLGHFIRDNLSSDLGPPVIYVDFGSATTDLFGHKKYLLTDFAWYAPYKPKVDALMSSVLWAFFGWRVFVRLPSIISGEGGQVAFLALSDLRRREDEYMESEKQRARGDKE